MKKTIWIIVGVLVVLLVLAGISFGLSRLGWVDGYGMMRPYGMHNWGFNTFGWGGMFLGMLGPLLLLVLFVGGIAWLIRWIVVSAVRASAPAGRSEAPQTAREILQARYARGEIDRDEYQRILADLEG